MREPMVREVEHDDDAADDVERVQAGDEEVDGVVGAVGGQEVAPAAQRIDVLGVDLDGWCFLGGKRY